ncbi:MAG: DEAD/DEAH box helicase [Bacillota bacterium]
MIVVDLVGSDIVCRVRATGNLFYEHVRTLRKLGFKFDGTRSWRIPYSPAVVDKLLAAFGGNNLAYLTSMEELKGESLELPEPDESFWEGLSDFKEFLAPLLKFEPRQYQWRGAYFLYKKERGLVADEMGLGKTFQGIMAVTAGLEEGKFSRALILCPSHLKSQWRTEFYKFTETEAVVLDGDRKKRSAIYDSLGERFVAVCGYETIRQGDRWDLDYLAGLGCGCVLCDEIHHARNRNTNTARALRSLVKKVPYRFLLTGTPFQKHAEDVYSIFEILDARILGKLGEFKKKYIIYSFNGHYTEIIGYRDLGDLHRRISVHMTRRRKSDVGLELPEKIEQTILVDMTDEQRKLHGELRAKLRSALEALKDAENAAAARRLTNEIKSVFTLLQEVADCPALLKMSSSPGVRKYGGSETSPKISLLRDIVSEKLAGGESVVIFTRFRRFAQMIAYALVDAGVEKAPLLVHQDVPKICKTGLYNCKMCPVFTLDSCESRIKIQEVFNAGLNKVLVCTDAAREGLNLTAGSTLVHADILWNPFAMDQRSDRIHRLDSPHERVHIIQLVSAGSIEEKMLERMRDRRIAGTTIVDGIRLLDV